MDQTLDDLVAEAESAVTRLVCLPRVSANSMLRACDSFDFLRPPLRSVLASVGQIGCWLFVDLPPATIPEAVRVAHSLAGSDSLPYSYANVARCHEILLAAKLPGSDILDIAHTVRELHKWALAVSTYFMATCEEAMTKPPPQPLRVKRMENSRVSHQDVSQELRIDRTTDGASPPRTPQQAAPIPLSRAKPILRGQSRVEQNSSDSKVFRLDRTSILDADTTTSASPSKRHTPHTSPRRGDTTNPHLAHSVSKAQAIIPSALDRDSMRSPRRGDTTNPHLTPHSVSKEGPLWKEAQAIIASQQRAKSPSSPFSTRRAILEPLHETVYRRALDDIRNNRASSSVLLRDVGMKAEHMIALCYALQQSPYVTHLDISHNDVGADGAKELVYCLRNGAENLRRIEFHDALVPPELAEKIDMLCKDRSEVAVVAAAVAKLKLDNVKTLDVRQRCLGDDSLVAICRAAYRTANCRTIDFSYNPVTAIGAQTTLHFMETDMRHGVLTFLLEGCDLVPAIALQRLRALCALRLARTGSLASGGAARYEGTTSPPKFHSPRPISPDSFCPLRRVASFAILKVRQQLGFSEEELRQLFHELDPTDRGWLEKSEFRKMYMLLENFGVPQSSESVDDMLARYNMIGPTKLSFDEFAIIMLKVAQR